MLHAEHYRPADKAIAERLSRHYYDVYKLYHTEIGASALSQKDLLASVVRHKGLFFRSSWAHYQLAVPGSIKLLPAQHRLSQLRADYLAMAEMIFGEPPPFDDILQTLQVIEQQING